MASKKPKTATEAEEPKKKREVSEETVKLRRYLNARREVRVRSQSVELLKKKLADAEAKLATAREEFDAAKSDVGEL